MLKVQSETIWSTPQLLKATQTLMDLSLRFHFTLLFRLLIQRTHILRKKKLGEKIEIILTVTQEIVTHPQGFYTRHQSKISQLLQKYLLNKGNVSNRQGHLSNHHHSPWLLRETGGLWGTHHPSENMTFSVFLKKILLKHLYTLHSNKSFPTNIAWDVTEH